MKNNPFRDYIAARPRIPPVGARIYDYPEETESEQMGLITALAIIALDFSIRAIIRYQDKKRSR